MRLGAGRTAARVALGREGSLRSDPWRMDSCPQADGGLRWPRIRFSRQAGSQGLAGGEQRSLNRRQRDHPQRNEAGRTQARTSLGARRRGGAT